MKIIEKLHRKSQGLIWYIDESKIYGETVQEYVKNYPDMTNKFVRTVLYRISSRNPDYKGLLENLRKKYCNRKILILTDSKQLNCYADLQY